MKKDKLKMICNWDQDYDKVVTIEWRLGYE